MDLGPLLRKKESDRAIEMVFQSTLGVGITGMSCIVRGKHGTRGGMVNGRQKDITVLLNTRYVNLIELYFVMFRGCDQGDANGRQAQNRGCILPCFFWFTEPTLAPFTR